MNKTVSLVSKILVAILTVILALTMTSCGKSDAVANYQKALDNLNKAGEMSADISLDAKVSMQGMEIPIKADMTVAYTGFNDKENPLNGEMALTGSMTLMGETTDVKAYIKDKKIYIDSNGTKEYAEFSDIDGLEKQLKETVKKDASLKIDEDYVKEANVDGDKTTLEFDGQKLFTEKIVNEIIKKELKESLAEETGVTLTDDAIEELGKIITVNSLKTTATIKDDNFTSNELSTNVKVDVAKTAELAGKTTGEEVSNIESLKDVEATFEMTIKLDNIKTKDVKVEIPDVSSYKGNTTIVQ